MKKKQTIPVFKKRKNKKDNIIIGPGQSKHIKIIGPELSFEKPDVDKNYVDKATYGELTEKIPKLDNNYLLIGDKKEESVDKKDKNWLVTFLISIFLVIVGVFVGIIAVAEVLRNF